MIEEMRREIIPEMRRQLAPSWRENDRDHGAAQQGWKQEIDKKMVGGEMEEEMQASCTIFSNVINPAISS